MPSYEKQSVEDAIRENAIWDKNAARCDAKLKPLLTDAFLATLHEVARHEGIYNDHIATADFVHGCYELAGKECPDIIPYDFSKEISNVLER